MFATLTNNEALDWHYEWSPDGTRIAFESARDGNREIYVMNADGSGLHNLTNDPNQDEWPAWSPDGTELAFLTNRHFGYSNWEIYLMNADGTGLRRLTGSGWGEIAWSPDGKKMTYGCNAVCVINVDGSGFMRFAGTSVEPLAFEAAWSPDGQKIAFRNDDEIGGHYYGEIDAINTDGTGLVNLTNTPADDRQAQWSPDGAKIAFQSDRDGIREIYVMNADGSAVTRVTNTGGGTPAWSRDGTRIAFSSNYGINLMSAGGLGVHRVTDNGSSPAWRPQMRSLARAPRQRTRSR